MEILSKYLLIILIAPLSGFMINGFLYKRLPKSAISFVACSSILVSFIFSCLSYFYLKQIHLYRQKIDYFKLIDIQFLKVDFSLLIDNLSIIYLLIITGVGFLIHLYSVGYMNHDKGIGRYFSYLNLFVFSMLLLVLGANYFILFIGWEGVGFCSFLLIGFWNDNKNYTYAAKKAFIINRIGDLCFLLALFILLIDYQSLDYNVIQQSVDKLKYPNNTMEIVTLLIFVGATGKSAQIPLFTWLPDAMAGPTPVSALIHAATMVTAGIYLIARSYFLFELSPFTLNIISIVGVSTAFIAATIACTQKDIKKILAYSTVSQLGFMFLSMGVGNYEGAVFHVITHAFFKALLFLGAGSIIHSLEGEQDITKMGGLKSRLKITHITFLIACLAISGIPGFSGFFSKESILISAFANNKYLYYSAVLIATLTSFYIFRLYFLVFYGPFRNNTVKKKEIHEGPISMTIPLIILSILSIAAGYINIPSLFGGSLKLSNYLSPVIQIIEVHIPVQIKLILVSSTVVLVISMVVYAYKKYSVISNYESNYKKSTVFSFFRNKWYLDEFYDTIIVNPVLYLSKIFKEIVESRVIDNMVNRIGDFVFFISTKIRYLQDGKISLYMFFTILSVILLFIFLLK